MNDAAPIVLLMVALGVAAYAFTLDADAQPKPQAPPDPLSGAIAGAIGEGVRQASESIDNLRDPESAERDGLRTLGDSLRKLFTGKEDATTKHRKQAAEVVARDRRELVAMEEWVHQLFSKLSRPDVERWEIGTTGTWRIYYRYRSSPVEVSPPATAANPLAWSVELPVRLFGAVAQQGSGPIGTALHWEDPPAFSDANPEAPTDLRRSRYLISQAELEERFVEDHPDSVTPNAPAQPASASEPAISLFGLDLLAFG